MAPKEAAKNQPSFPAAEHRTFAGPFLRFGGGAEPGSRRWRGSVLCLTRAAPAGPLPPPASPAAAPAAAASANGGESVPAGLPAAPAGGLQQQGLGQGQPGPVPVLTLDADSREHGSGTVEGVPLDACLGWTAWRFDLELPLLEWQRPVRYTITADGNRTPTYTFWLPALGQPMHWGYYSCNGLSADVKASAPERQDPTYLWRDLLQLHSAFPLHCLVGGGDQVYSDGVWKTPALREWGASADYEKKIRAEWTPEMESEATAFYLRNYIDAFSTPDIDLGLAQIPAVNMWDDHDIWDGYGSYDAEMQDSAVFKTLFRIARRFYLLFQQHTTDAFNARAREFLGANDGASFHLLRWMGPQVVLLGMDMRSERTKQRIMPQPAYELFRRTVEALPSGPLHLVVLSGVPVIFPKIPTAETILGCIGRVTRSVPAIKQAARSTGLLDRFDQPEILDDLTDGWVAEVHSEERMQFIRMLQDWSLNKKLRVSILSGDAHVGGVGRFYSRPKMRDLGDDPLYIQQIISSAIVNAPPPHPVVRMLMRTNFASNVDHRTREKLVRAFYPRHPRTDKLIAQRNWCDVCLVAPPFTPPTVPQDEGFGGLLFQLRVENASHRRGYAEEVYRIMVPRHPGATMSSISGAARAVPAGVPLPEPLPSPTFAEAELTPRQQQRRTAGQEEEAGEARLGEGRVHGTAQGAGQGLPLPRQQQQLPGNAVAPEAAAAGADGPGWLGAGKAQGAPAGLAGEGTQPQAASGLVLQPVTPGARGVALV